MNKVLQHLSAAAALLLFVPGPAFAEDVAGEFDYYTLALSWSPTYCATRRSDSRPNEPQCAGDRPYHFILHGFWPQYDRGWPKDCLRGERVWIPEDVITNMLDIMPSKRLIIHEYRKHGVCSGLKPQDYFRLSRQAFDKIKVPARFQSLDAYLTISPEELEREFLKANPGLTPAMINIDCKNRRLREMRICFTRDLALKACGSNEQQGKLCSAEKIVMPPVRIGSWRNGNNERNGDGDENSFEEDYREDDDD